MKMLIRPLPACKQHRSDKDSHLRLLVIGEKSPIALLMQVVEHLPQLTGMNGDFAFGHVIALHLNSSGQQLGMKHRARVIQDRRQPCQDRELTIAMRRQRLLGKL